MNFFHAGTHAHSHTQTGSIQSTLDTQNDMNIHGDNLMLLPQPWDKPKVPFEPEDFCVRAGEPYLRDEVRMVIRWFLHYRQQRAPEDHPRMTALQYFIIGAIDPDFSL